jgi:DNA polymerase-4
MMLDPTLRGKPVAVCGSTEDRHGIVLTKSDLAKKAGIKTGMVNWEARRLCPNLIMIPPHYDQYMKYSKLTRAIYERYTDCVEPFGIDECWLDVTGSTRLFGSGYEIAHKIKETVKEELGLTVSIGVSYNKIFAKLGSDMKKPDAITCIEEETFKEQIWKLPASDLLGVGYATNKKLSRCAIRTIGDLATMDPVILKHMLGINGEKLYNYANGIDYSRVMNSEYITPIKSVGHGITCVADLENDSEVWKVILELTQDISHKLRINGLCANGVSLSVKDNTLYFKEYQCKLDYSSQSAMEIAKMAHSLFEKNYNWDQNVRALTVRAINVAPQIKEQQLNIFYKKQIKRERAELTVEQIRERFGKTAVMNAILMKNNKMPIHRDVEIIMPSVMYQ